MILAEVNSEELGLLATEDMDRDTDIRKRTTIEAANLNVTRVLLRFSIMIKLKILASCVVLNFIMYERMH